MGEDALLRGEVVDPPRKAHIARGVEMYDREGNVMYAEFVATLNKVDAPVKGDTLVQGNDSFVLENQLDDNGYSVRFVLRRVP
jgi:hypothetical protein